MQTRHHTANPAYQAALTRYRTRQAEKAAEPKPGQRWEKLPGGVTPRQEDTGTIEGEAWQGQGWNLCAIDGVGALMSGHSE
jgi:hypothetical protein